MPTLKQIRLILLSIIVSTTTTNLKNDLSVFYIPIDSTLNQLLYLFFVHKKSILKFCSNFSLFAIVRNDIKQIYQQYPTQQAHFTLHSQIITKFMFQLIIIVRISNLAFNRIRSKSSLTAFQKMELLKIPCAFHENQFITNFCLCPQCLLPLCPICVKIHTSEHIQMKIDPQYQHVHQLMHQIQIDIDNNINHYNSDYKNIVELDAKIDQFRNVLRNKIESLKSDIMQQVDTYFKKLHQKTEVKINSMNYINTLSQFKEHTKKSILYMKGIQRAMVDPYKVMRTLIKYKSQHVKDVLSKFHGQASQFVTQMDRNFISFSIRQDYKQALECHLDQIKKIQIHDLTTSIQPIDLPAKLKEVALRENEKKEIKKSIANLMHRNSTPDKSMDLSRNQSIDGRRRSLSKGKGLTVMQNMHNILNQTINPSGVKFHKPIRLLNIDDSFENLAPKGRITTTAARRHNR